MPRSAPSRPSSAATRRARRERLTVRGYLEEWLAQLKTSDSVKTSTLERYHTIATKHVTPIIGGMLLTKVTSATCVALYAELEKLGRSPSTRRKAHATLSAAFSDAVPRLIATNPLAGVPKRIKPKYKPADAEPYTAEEIRTFIRTVAGTRYAALYAVALFPQLCESEIFALERSEISDDRSVIFVRESKTEAGIRRV